MNPVLTNTLLMSVFTMFVFSQIWFSYTNHKDLSGAYVSVHGMWLSCITPVYKTKLAESSVWFWMKHKNELPI